jgi:hypothetical protein
MRVTGILTSALLGIASLGVAPQAIADSMDPALARLVVDERCRTDGQAKLYDPTSGFVRCEPDHMAFGKLVAELGTALAPLASHPARTTGFGGYRFGVQGAYTTIDSDAPFWRKGTQGGVDQSTGLASTQNIDPDSLLQLYSITLAKGFPFGVELGGGFGYLVNTEIISGGGDVRVAIFEGFREHVPGFFPDIGVGGGVRTITGTSELKLTVASFDAQISKPIFIAGTVTLHPHVGYQWIHIFGDSGLIDLTPNTDALELCGYQGENNPAVGSPPYDGQPICTGSSADFNNNVVFDAVRLSRHRINFGSSLRYQMMQFGVHVVTDVVSPLEVNTQLEKIKTVIRDPETGERMEINKLADDPRTPENDEIGTQWTVAFEVGAVF